MATIKDVAAKANVSISTVSLAFNNPERVSENTRNKIFTVARKLNYLPANQVRKKESVKRKNSSCSYGKYYRPILVRNITWNC